MSNPSEHRQGFGFASNSNSTTDLLDNPPPYNTSNFQNEEDISVEAANFHAFDFSEKTIRMGFVRKVYSILMCQLLVTICFIVIFTFSDRVKLWTFGNPAVLIIAIILYIVLAIALICSGDLRRKAPMNFICLGIFTVVTGFMLGAATAAYEPGSVMLAVGITAAVVVSLTVYAFQTKYDFTVLGGALFCGMVVLILMGLMCAIIPSKALHIFYSSIGGMIFSLYILYDTQVMLGGKHKYSISPEEYIFAALCLYLDILNLFLDILRLVGKLKSRT